MSPTASIEAHAETLLVLSDVHLGSDLDDYAERSLSLGSLGSPRSPGSLASPASPDLEGNVVAVPGSERNGRKRSVRIDADLVALLQHYRRSASAAQKKWRLVIAGDFIDFLGMVIAPDAAGVQTAPSDEERVNGLGNAEDHARIKLQRVALRHSDVFDELAAFVADGHALTLVHGNHDLEFHWPAVQAEMKSQLFARAKASGSRDTDDVYSARIEFAPWFFYRDGVVYIEHGHQYDPFCATDHIMAPLSPLDPRRIARGFCDVLLRYVVRPTRGMSEHGHESKTMLDYLSFATNLGFGGMGKLGMRFVRAVLELFRLRRGHFNEAAKALRAEHERRVAALGEAKRIGLDRLRALIALQAPPLTRSVHGILASVLLDKLALAMAASLALLLSAVVMGMHGRLLVAVGLVIAAWFLAERYLSHLRQLDPSDQMIDRAAKLAKLFPAAFVVMGHTHVPVQIAVGGDGGSDDARATYVNLGSWAEEEPETAADGSLAAPAGPALAYRAARTHLIIHPDADTNSAHAEFLTWDPTDGPKTFPA